MTRAVRKITEQVRALPGRELSEFLEWLATYGSEQDEQWDREIERDFGPGGRLETMLDRVRADIAAGRTRPLDEVTGGV